MNVEYFIDDTIFVTVNDDEGISSLHTINCAAEQIELIIDQDDYSNSFDMDMVPGAKDQHPYYILHQASGLHLVDPHRKKLYTLSHEKNDNFATCRSIALTPLDDADPSKGFWLAWIDNSMNF